MSRFLSSKASVPSPLPIARGGTGAVTAAAARAALNAVGGLTISPAQITTDQNNYAPAGWSTALHVRINSDGTYYMTGFAAGVDGEIKVLENIGAIPLILLRESTSSSAANRITTAAGSVCLEPGGVLVLTYDGTTARWRVGGQHQAVPYFQATFSAAQQIVSGAWVPLAYDSEIYDPLGWYVPGVIATPTAGRFTPKIAGLYQVRCYNGLVSLDDGNDYELALYKNGAGYQYLAQFIGAAGTPYMSFSPLVYMNGTTDYIEQFIYHVRAPWRNTILGLVGTEFSAFYVGALMG
jgi:hypothetical protein